MEQNNAQSFTALIIDNKIDALATMASNAKKPGTGITKWHNGICIDAGTQFALLNGLFDRTLSDDHFPQQLQQAIDYFDNKKTPFTWWWLHNQALPTKMENTLTEYQFVSAGAYSGIVLALGENNLIYKPSPNVTTKQVQDNKSYQLFINILSETFQLSNSIQQDFHCMLSSYTDKDSALKHYIGYYKNQPVGVITSYIKDHVVGIYGGATLPNSRKKGICSSLIAKSLSDAKNEGCTVAVGQLMAANMAQGATEKIGFRKCCEFTPFVYGMNVNELEPRELPD